MKITTDDIMTLRPCSDWPRERVATIVGEGITPIEIARHPDIPIADRQWVLSHLLAVRDRRALVQWACECAQDVRHLTATSAATSAADAADAARAADAPAAAAYAASYAASYAAAAYAARAADAACTVAAARATCAAIMERYLEIAARYLQ